MPNLMMIKGDWDQTAQNFVDKQQSYSKWHGEKYFGLTVDDHLYFLFILNKTEYDYVPEEKWVKVSVIADWKQMRGAVTDRAQRRKYKHIGIYKAMRWCFEDLKYDGMYGMVRENDKSVYMFMDHMNGARTKSLGKCTSQGVPLHHWLFTKKEYEKDSRHYFLENANNSMLDF